MRLGKFLCALVGLAFLATHAYGQGTIEGTKPLLKAAFPKILNK
jgi:hypothetical protein